MEWVVVTTLMLLILIAHSEITTDENECDLIQYLTIGSNGTIQCSFSEYHAVSWYYPEKDKPILFYEEGDKRGDGYVSGDYDVYPNGSLYIRNVTLQQETLFRVTKVISLSEPTISYLIRVQTIIAPLMIHPVIEQCEDQMKLCYTTNEGVSTLSCVVRNVRPQISLLWSLRNDGRDMLLTSEFTVESRNNMTFTSRSTLQPSNKFPLLSALICRAEENNWLLEESETLAIFEQRDVDIVSKTNKQYVELHSAMVISCKITIMHVLVWKRIDTHNKEEVILLSVKTGKNDVNETYNNDFRLEQDGSLLLKNTEWHHQGRYICLSTDYNKEQIRNIDVIIFVLPVPRYIQITGCEHRLYCVMKVNQGDTLMCSVYGIRPKVDLEWKVYSTETKVSFLQQKHTVSQNGDNYDITLTSKITVIPTTKDRLTVECHVVGPNAEIFNLSATMDVLIPYEQQNENSVTVITIVIVATISVLVVVVLAVLLGIRRVRDSNGNRKAGNTKEETLPMMSLPMNLNNENNKTEQLIKELKGKYELLYETIQPIPYIKDRMFCVNNVYVEGSIEYLEQTSGTNSKDDWKLLASYRQLFDIIGDKPKIQILEGEPGYGKSTLTLQLAYDWCNHISNSPISKVKILVFLRLRQLGGVQSIHKAIRRFLLAKDSKLTDDDVKTILNESGSVLLILDGYDEYPDQGNMDTDISLIIKKEIMRDFNVILTTRSSYLPKYRVPKPSRVRLRGFDETARDQYIRKAVVGDDDDEVEKIKLKLKQNPVLGDMCEVPLFFVMFAHMTHESKNLQTFHSVTGFFRYMISCFHSHLRNKMSDENVQMLEAHESDHNLLDKVAFEALSGDHQQIVWKKEQLLKPFGEEFYKHYIQLGILVEDDVLDFDDSRAAASYAQYNVEVRFYHKLFCEWYAAHYLARNVSELSSNADQLLGNLDPFDLQYVYRFACGLNKDASENIIKYLQRTDDGQKFAILCILEQKGNMQNLVEIVTKLVSNNIEIHQNDSRLLQRSTLQILQFASKKEIPITCLKLTGSFKQCGESNIVLHSGLILTDLSTLENIQIEIEKETNEPKVLSEKEIKTIFQYVLRSGTFKKLSFDSCLLPLTFVSESIPAEMQSRDIKVCWNDYGYSLNLQSGVWEVDNEDLVRKLCTKDVCINRYNSELLQRCTIQLLENASYHDIPITSVYLHKSFKECKEDAVVFHSGLRLNQLLTVEKIHIGTEHVNREPRILTEKDVTTILRYGLRSEHLKELSFADCTLPLSLSSESLPRDMRSRDIKVCWSLLDSEVLLNLQSGQWEVEDKESLRQLCSVKVVIEDHYLQQYITIISVQTASNHHIPISCVHLVGCSPRVDESGLHLILRSGLSLSILSSLQKLDILDSDMRLTNEELATILSYSSQCTGLRELQFGLYVLPDTIPVESIPSSLKSRNVKVWNTRYPQRRLNLKTGRWQVCDIHGRLPGEEAFDESSYQRSLTRFH